MSFSCTNLQRERYPPRLLPIKPIASPTDRSDFTKSMTAPSSSSLRVTVESSSFPSLCPQPRKSNLITASPSRHSRLPNSTYFSLSLWLRRPWEAITQAGDLRSGRWRIPATFIPLTDTVISVVSIGRPVALDLVRCLCPVLAL